MSLETVFGWVSQIDPILDNNDVQVGLIAPVFLDHDKGLVYLAKVEFTPYDSERMEFSFSVVVVSEFSNTETEYMSGLETRDFFTSLDRMFMRRVINELIQRLLMVTRPPKIYRCTADSNPPPIAKEKHLGVTKFFEAHGYRVEKHDEWNGKAVWEMELIEPEEK